MIINCIAPIGTVLSQPPLNALPRVITSIHCLNNRILVVFVWSEIEQSLSASAWQVDYIASEFIFVENLAYCSLWTIDCLSDSALTPFEVLLKENDLPTSFDWEFPRYFGISRNSTSERVKWDRKYIYEQWQSTCRTIISYAKKFELFGIRLSKHIL